MIDNQIPEECCTLSCFIEPVKQKVFQFNVENSLLANSHNLDDYHNKKWTPVLSCKRLYGEPKFIMSLQRKKARIISGIRDRQVQECEKKRLGPIGGKVRNRNFRNLQSRIISNSSFEMDHFVGQQEIKLQKTFQFKQKKNPYMNFSLMYISEKKKNYDTQTRSKIRASSAYYIGSQRQKGSDNAYAHCLVSENHSKREKARPQTSCLSDRNRNDRRPKSGLH